jgi:hypothetical protein
MIKLKDILNESDIKWGTLDKIIKTAKYDPATGKKILKWAATHPSHNPYILKKFADIKDPSTSYWRKEMKLLNQFIETEDDIWPAHKGNYLDKHGHVYNGKKLNKIILAYWFSTTKWRK